MPNYTVTVATGTQWFAGTDDYIYITLVGSESCSERTLLDKPLYNDFERGAVDSYDISVGEDLGEIELVKIEKKKYWVHDDWYCKYITVKTPYGDYVEFPCFRWLVDDKEVILRDGRARLPQHAKTRVAKQHRRKELEQRQKTYRWKEWHPGFPMSIDAKAHSELPRDIQFDSEKGVDFVLNYSKAIENLYVNQFMHMFQSSWGDFADFERIFMRIKNTISEYVMEHWKEDFMFGYQFLNGCNPVVIRKCTEIPDKFPVTQKIVEDSLERGLTLEEELKEGNIFIADYELLDGVTPNSTDPCTLQYLAAPICLLYKNIQNKIMPIAIQLSRCFKPGEDNPIFLPSDDEYDWLLAKIWVRSSDFHVHQTVTHLLRTHLISEVFGIALFRQLPAVHPVFKLLLPHIRFTIAINTKAREQLICECGLFDKANGTGGGGHVELVQKSMKTFTYRSLCFPEAIKARGMDSKEELPYYFYRDDGYSVWEAVTSFVTDVVDIYYDKDETVQEDTEIQAFVKDVCSFGIDDTLPLSAEFPKSLQTKEQLVEYLTIVIFTASAQHAAVNFGQFDWCSWIPNSPPTMRKPPPTKKGEVDLKYIVESLPDRGRSCWHLGAVWALSQFQENELFLGMYPDEHFIEKPVKEAMAKFRKNLAEVVKVIKSRNEGKKLPYYYFSPDRIPNSVAV
uniref:Arachidonate 5-lipoxygenase a n=2 Tax=Cyprinus carpio TaxID=7962 RepID=A0A9J7WVU0_CYPCA